MNTIIAIGILLSVLGLSMVCLLEYGAYKYREGLENEELEGYKRWNENLSRHFEKKHELASMEEIEFPIE